MILQRTFALSTEDPRFCGAWKKETVSISGDDLAALRGLVSENYPQRRIVELIGPAMATVMVPIVLIVEARIPDIAEMTPDKARELLQQVVAAASLRLPSLSEAIEEDQGYRVSYMWDGTLKSFILHLVCPNTYRQASELHLAFKGMRLTSHPLNTSYRGLILQDKVLGHSHCIPIYLGPTFTVIESKNEGFLITRSRPQMAKPVVDAQEKQLAIPETPKKLRCRDPASGLNFGQTSMWLAPIQHVVEFLIRMIRSRTSEYDNLCCDVAYYECGSLSDVDIPKMIGMAPRPDAKERTVRFLHWVAKRVSPEAYSNWIYEQAAIIAYQFFHQAVTDELLQRLLLLGIEGEFISVVDGRDPNAAPKLYYFKNIWKIDKGMEHLNKTICRQIPTFIGEDLKQYMQETGQFDIYKVMLQELLRLNYMTSMRAQNVKAIARMLMEEVRFDEDPNLVGCNNVVIEVNDRHGFVRPGRPEDLVSMSTHLYYRQFSEEECEEVHTLFRKLFADEEVREWFKRLTYSMLLGRNPERRFYVPFGCAKNGKSGYLNFLEAVLGDYYDTFSSSAFNPRSDASATSPELAAMHGKRALGCSELKAGAQIEADIIKALVGDDKGKVRALYQDPVSLRLMAKIIIATNHFPVFLHADKALRDRLVLIPMTSIFKNRGAPVNEADQYRLSHFPADTNFRETLKRMAPKLLYMMVEGFAEYKLLGIDELPKIVQSLTDGYWHDTGVQSRFITDCLGFDDGDEEEPDSPKAGGKIKTVGDLPKGPGGRRKLPHVEAYDRFRVWAISRKMDISKYPFFTFKSLMDSELASLDHHVIKFDLDGWVGCFVKS